jgi:chromosome segregation ATPase
MNDEMAVSGAEINALSTFDRKELIDGVVQKHKKFLDEYVSEFNELGNKIKALQDTIVSSKKNREDALEKIEILAEKRQLFYHQAEKLLDELDDSISNNSTFSREMSFVKKKLSKVKGSLTSDEEQKQVDSILQSISSLSSKASGIEDRLDAVKERIKVALISKTELSSIDSSEESYNNSISSLEGELNEITPRYKWLENRVQSHTDALQYWEKQPAVADAEEVKA